MKEFKHDKSAFTSVIAESIMQIFETSPKKQFNFKQLCSKLGVERKDMDMIRTIILQLIADRKILEPERGKFKLSSAHIKTGFLTGKVEIISSGDGFIVSDKTGQDTYVREKNLCTALHGDKVKFRLFPERRGRKPEGEVMEVTERAKSEYVGTIEISEHFGFLVSDSKKAVDIYIPLENLGGARHGEKAVAKIIEWTQGKSPTGEIIRVLGKAGENETEMNAIMAEFGLPYLFPKVVEEDAAKIPMEIPDKEYKLRRDFRETITFTIDPVDAKDFDDALSIKPAGEKDGNPLFEIGIHIADVSHYVLPDSILDDEAILRGTSVYLVDRVVPMLPEHLSNGVCSLRPNEDKLCFSAVFILDEKGVIQDEWYGRTIINSNKRFSYEEAQLIIEGGNSEFKTEVLTLDKIAKELRKERFKRGSIGFEKIEVKFKLDDKGKPLGVFFKESKDSNKLIEEFMLLANKKVAELVSGITKSTKKSRHDGVRPFVYRIHDKPNEDKITEFSQFIGKFGYRFMATSPNAISNELNKLMKEIKGKKEENVIEQLAIRTMAKAVYSSNNIGHYGLGFEHYTHFTSPIRRYPDVLSHRILQQFLDDAPFFNEADLEDLCKQSSDMEKRASDAERSSIKYKQVQFMYDKLGQVFKGVISGVTDWGFFVEIIENKCEGLVRLRDMTDDYYQYDELNYCIKGRRKGTVFQLGDLVNIEVKKADLVRKQLDFLLVDKE